MNHPAPSNQHHRHHHHHHQPPKIQEDRPPYKMMKPPTVNITKLRGAFKKINSLGHILNHHRSTSAPADFSTVGGAATPAAVESTPSVDVEGAGSEGAGPGADPLMTVYVGKSRRAYRVEPELLDHPVLQELVDRSDGSGEILVACEVVLFDHLRWMIHNSDPQLERLDDLKEFYAY